MYLRSDAQHLAPAASTASRRDVMHGAGKPWGTCGLGIRSWFTGFGQLTINATTKRPARHLRMQPT